MNGAYHPIPIARIFRAFQRVAMAVGNYGRSVRDGDGGTGCICVYCKCLLGGEKSTTIISRATKRTLKTRRISSRSDLQTAIVSLSFFAWKRRENAFRLPHPTSFFWMSATVLRSGVLQRAVRDRRSWFNSRQQLIYRAIHGLTELVRSLSTRPLVKRSADIGTKQPEFDVIQVVDR